MPLFEDTAEDEIRRLRRIIEKLETEKGTRVVTVEMVPHDKFGYLFYITGPTTADEAVFGLAMSQTIERAFRVIGADLKTAFTGGNHVAPPKGTVQ
jgi:hypothetical protein